MPRLTDLTRNAPFLPGLGEEGHRGTIRVDQRDAGGQDDDKRHDLGGEHDDPRSGPKEPPTLAEGKE